MLAIAREGPEGPSGLLTVGVTFIDGRGVDMLRRIGAGRLRVVNCSGFVEHVLYGTGESKEDRSGYRDSV